MLNIYLFLGRYVKGQLLQLLYLIIHFLSSVFSYGHWSLYIHCSR